MPSGPDPSQPHSPCPVHRLYPCKAFRNKLSPERTMTRLKHADFGVNQATGWQMGSAGGGWGRGGSPCSTAQLPKSLCTTAMGQRFGFPPALGVQSFTWLHLPLALTSACQLGKKSFEISVFIRSSVPDALDRPAAFSLRQRLGGSYSTKMVECPQVSGSFWRCKHGFSQRDTWKERKLVARRGGREVSCPYPAQANIPQGCYCLEQARNTITASFQTSFSLVSASNKTVGSLAVATAEPSAPRNQCQPTGPSAATKTSPPQSRGAGSKACPRRKTKHPSERRLAAQHPALCDLTRPRPPGELEGCRRPLSPCHPLAPSKRPHLIPQQRVWPSAL